MDKKETINESDSKHLKDLKKQYNLLIDTAASYERFDIDGFNMPHKKTFVDRGKYYDVTFYKDLKDKIYLDIDVYDTQDKKFYVVYYYDGIIVSIMPLEDPAGNHYCDDDGEIVLEIFEL